MTQQLTLVRILDEDPDLGGDLGEDEFEQASRVAVAPLERLERGVWDPSDAPRRPGDFGLLVLEGLLARRVSIGERTCAEILGPGDVLRPWVRATREVTVQSEVNWSVIVEAQLARLDGSFVQRLTRWPEIIAEIGNRVMLRAHWLAFHLAVCHMRRVDERLLIVLWHFADRWGKVTPDGVVLPLPFTHRLLASVIGAQRASVSTAVSQLVRQGVVTRLPDRGWLLRGRPPTGLHEIYQAVGGADRAPEPLEPEPEAA